MEEFVELYAKALWYEDREIKNVAHSICLAFEAEE